MKYFLLLSLFCASCLTADIVTEWNTVALDILKTNATSPPKVSRDLAIVHIAMYDAWHAIDPMYAPFYFSTNAPMDTSTNALLSYAAYTTLSHLYPSNATELTSALSNSTASIPESQAKTNGMEFGTAVAHAIIARRSNDGWNVVVPYIPGTNTGEWRPTLPDFLPALDPQWGQVEPFAVTNVPAYRPGPPPAITSLAYYTAWNNVRVIGQDSSTNRTPDQSQIAEFWNDFPGLTAAPAGKWNLIAQTLATLQSNTVAQNVRMFAMINVALGDAGILSWDQKYYYNFWRPITAIRLAEEDGNPLTFAVTNWTPSWPSPNFPEYTSGHSCFSGAGAEMLELYFGTDNIPFSIHAGFDVLPGVTRSYSSIWQAAEEAGQSRIYGGIHFDFANVNGLSLGSNAAVFAFNNYFEIIPEPSCAAFITLILLRMRRKLCHPVA